MFAAITLADLQLQIGSVFVLVVVVAAVFFMLGRISGAAAPTEAEEQAEIDRIEAEILASCERHNAQMTPFRGPLGPAIDEESEASVVRAKRIEWLLQDIADECESTFVDPSEMSREWVDLTRRIRELAPKVGQKMYTEHSPQIPELRKPGGPFEDDWRGGEYGGSPAMLRQTSREIED